MGTNDRAVDRGKRHARRLRRELGEELRVARVAAGLSHRAVESATGIARSTIGRIERDEDVSVSIAELAVLFATVGRKLVASAVPDGTAYRDGGHHGLGVATHALVPASAPWRTEVPFPNPGDLRSWDVLTILERKRVAFELETHPRDGQELRRGMNQKRRDGGADRLVLVLLDSRANRRFLADHAQELAADFPTPGAEVLQALAEGRAPGDGIILVKVPRGSGTRTTTAPRPADRRAGSRAAGDAHDVR